MISGIKKFFKFIHNFLFLLVLKRLVPISILRMFFKINCSDSEIKIIKNVEPKRKNDVEITPFKHGAEGCLCISIDFEMSWGTRTIESSLAAHFAKLERENVPYIIDILEKFSTPATWAIVGHLFLTKCDRDKNSGLAHPDMPRPKFHKNRIWSYSKGDWYQGDPCSDFEKDKDWYAPDLIDNILGSRVRHELATHSFSHVDFSNCSEEVAIAELTRCKELMQKKNLSLSSMVFPGNLIDNLRILSKLDLLAYRGNDECKIQYPTRIPDGIWNIPQSIQLAGRLRENHLSNLVKRLIDKTIGNCGVLHMWFHPFEMDRPMINSVLSPILTYADSLRRKKKLWIATMQEIASYCQLRESCLIKMDNHNHKKNIIIESGKPVSSNLKDVSLTVKVRKGKEVIINGLPLKDYEYFSEGEYCIVTISLNQNQATKKYSNISQ